MPLHQAHFLRFPSAYFRPLLCSAYRHGNAPILAFCPGDLYNFLIRLFSFQGACNKSINLLTGLSLH